MGMWVLNSERGHKIRSLEGENEIPHILFYFLTILAPLDPRGFLDLSNFYLVKLVSPPSNDAKIVKK